MSYNLKQRGLHTYRNELNVPDGAMDLADNIVIDEDDVVEIRRGQADFGDDLPQEEDRLKQITEYKDLVIRHFSTTLQFDDGNGSFTDFAEAISELEPGLRIKSLEANGNFYMTDIEGIKKITARNASQVTANSIEDAGVPRAVDLEARLKFVTSGFLPAQSKTAIRVVWGTRDNNNNLLLGYPSERFVLTNSSSDTSIPETSTITVNIVPTNSDYITFESVNTQYFVWFDETGTDDEPQTSDTLGRTAIRVDINVPGITISDVASRIANAIAAIGEFTTSVASNVVTMTALESGNTEDIDTNNTTNFTVSVEEQGLVSEGTQANPEVTFSIPNGIDTNYFYQVYMTQTVTVPEGLTLESIDPGDEMNLVLEVAVTEAQLAAGSINEEIIITEDFRASAAPLYTNPVTGEGILQANAIPPIAKDIALFRNSVFYANTKTVHRTTLNLVSVLNMSSGFSELIIGNNEVTRTYQAVGETQVQDVTLLPTASLSGGEFHLLESARNEVEYFVWFDIDGVSVQPTSPETENRIAIRVKIATGDTATQVAEKYVAALNATDDFLSTNVADVATITWAKNGDTLDARDSTDAPTGFTFSTPSTQGQGEDTSNQQFLLSNQISVAQSIDETARSIVKVVNADVTSPVNAFYLSGADDVPGIILFENRSLEDREFFIGTNDTAIARDFEPTLPVAEVINGISAANPTTINAPAHNLITGDEIYIYGTDSNPVLLGKFEATVVDVNNFTVPQEVLVAGTQGFFFKTTVTSDNEESPNRVYYSKVSQPESVPILNFIDIGPKDEKIQRIIALRDNLFALKEDGIYIITGTSAPNFTSRLLDGSVGIEAPDTAVVLNNRIFALSSEGVVAISETGVQIVSRKIEDIILKFTTSKFSHPTLAFGVTYSSDRAYLLWLQTEETDTTATQCFRYNTFTDTWTRFTITATCGKVITREDRMFLGSGDRNVMTRERKDKTRTDYADRDFDLTLNPSGVNDTTLSLSTVVDIELGDVVYQEQYVTISYLRRLVRKLDFDADVVSSDYEASVNLNPGILMSAQLDTVNTKLVADGIIVTPVSFSDDIETQRDQLSTMIDEINDTNSGSQFKDYNKAEDLVPYETIVTDITDLTNIVDTEYAVPFLEGSVTIFRGISVKFQYAPIHFGDPSVLKQVRQGTLIFDQNNFFGGTISYASDLSADFVSTPFNGLGTGDWGGPNWGEGTWGGSGNDIPYRTLVPLEKQRCRYLTIRIEHINARERVRLNGFSLLPRSLSSRAYR